MIDMHSHILPNIDDGAKSVEETYDLIKEAKQAGFNAIVSTSHYIEGYYEKDEDTRRKLIENLPKEDIEIFVGSEIYLSDNIVELLNTKKASVINNSKYILFEMPMNIEPMNLYNVVYEMLQHKLVPILAHPERYTFVHKNPNIIYELISKGVLMQGNYGSIIGQYGKKPQIIIKKFLKNNMIHFLGSDVHRKNTIYLKIPQILRTLKDLIGEEKINELSLENPKKVIQNANIDIIEPEEFRLTFIEKMILKQK